MKLSFRYALGVIFLTTNVVVAYADCSAFQPVLNLMQQRALLLKDVAANKYNAHPPQSVYDAKQELKVLNNLASNANKLGLDKNNLLQFAQLQMDFSKQVEEYWLSIWQANNALAPQTGSYKSLAEVRQQIQKIDGSLYPALALALNAKNKCNLSTLKNQFTTSFKSIAGIPQNPDFSELLTSALLNITPKLSATSSNNESASASGTLFQVAPIAALAQGVDDGNYTYGELKQQGNFGMGTFLNYDGEMVALNGQFYQMLADGHIKQVLDDQIVPFADVTDFHPTISESLPTISSYAELAKKLQASFANKNIPYAIKIDGVFKFVKLRAVRKQAPRTRLANAAKNQVVFSFSNVKGTLVGFWVPEYLSGVAVTGLHLHFIDENHQLGGHVLDLSLSNGELSVEPLSNFNLYFPQTASFAAANLADKSIAGAIVEAEKNH